MLIEKAVELISALGTEALTISALARESGINRSTVYYHFESREALIDAVQAWCANRISRGFHSEGNNATRVAEAAGFVLENPEVMKLWIDDFISGGDIRDRYPLWDELVTLVSQSPLLAKSPEPVDPDALGAILLAGTLIGTRVYSNSVRPGVPNQDAVDRLARTQLWLLRLCGVG